MPYSMRFARNLQATGDIGRWEKRRRSETPKCSQVALYVVFFWRQFAKAALKE